MMRIRRAAERGYEDKGWVQTYHTFSFDTYYDPQFLGFHTLKVINEDTLPGGKGFGVQYQKEMEILTYVLEGALEHKDSLGNGTVVSAGEWQCLSAGLGLTYSDSNLSHHLPVRFLQIWLLPEHHSLDPTYNKRSFSPAAKWGQWCLIASANGRNGSLPVYQDVDLYALVLEKDEEMIYESSLERQYWIHVVKGEFHVQGQLLQAGDGAALNQESEIKVKCQVDGELLLLDLG